MLQDSYSALNDDQKSVVDATMYTWAAAQKRALAAIGSNEVTLRGYGARVSVCVAVGGNEAPRLLVDGEATFKNKLYRTRCEFYERLEKSIRAVSHTEPRFYIPRVVDLVEGGNFWGYEAQSVFVEALHPYAEAIASHCRVHYTASDLAAYYAAKIEGVPAMADHLDLENESALAADEEPELVTVQERLTAGEPDLSAESLDPVDLAHAVGDQVARLARRCARAHARRREETTLRRDGARLLREMGDWLGEQELELRVARGGCGMSSAHIPASMPSETHKFTAERYLRQFADYAATVPDPSMVNHLLNSLDPNVLVCIAVLYCFSSDERRKAYADD